MNIKQTFIDTRIIYPQGLRKLALTGFSHQHCNFLDTSSNLKILRISNLEIQYEEDALKIFVKLSQMTVEEVQFSFTSCVYFDKNIGFEKMIDLMEACPGIIKFSFNKISFNEGF